MSFTPHRLSSMQLSCPSSEHGCRTRLLAVVLTAMACGMGWGIRGQYGHETGAMIAGVLSAMTLVLLFAPDISSLKAARTVALTAVGISLGGSMTYGQTIGLTQDVALIGNAAALRWGLVGLFVKGGIWIGFAGAFLGIGLSAQRYRPAEMVRLLLGMTVLFVLGLWALNSPFDPAHKILPRFYFSDDWYWEPRSDLKPRPECWGGLLFALLGLAAYLHRVRRDRLARNMAVVGFLAGGLGFSLGQCVQAFHAWNPHRVVEWLPGNLAAHVNWWNMMEITFGAISGAVLAGGLWLNRHLIAPPEPSETDVVVLSPVWEFVLLAVHLVLLIAAEFTDVPLLELYLEYGLLMSAIPLVGVVGGRYWPYLFPLVIVAVPIAGKTLRELAYRNAEMSQPLGWLVLVAVPLVVMLIMAMWLARRGEQGDSARRFAGVGLLSMTWLYFGLNFGFFRLPWPWSVWTGRTPSGIIFTVCALCLTVAAIIYGRGPVRVTNRPSVPDGPHAVGGADR